MPWEADDFDLNSTFNVVKHVDFLAIPTMSTEYVESVVSRTKNVLTHRGKVVTGRDCRDLFENCISTFSESDINRFSRNVDEVYNGTLLSFLNRAYAISPKSIFIILVEEYPFSDVELEALWKYAFSLMAQHDVGYSYPLINAIGKDISSPLAYIWNKDHTKGWFAREIVSMLAVGKEIQLQTKEKALFKGWRYENYSQAEAKICKSFKFKFKNTILNNSLTHLFAIEKMIYESGGKVIWNDEPFRKDYQEYLFEDIR